MQSLTQTPEQLFKNYPVFFHSTRMLADVYGLYPEERALIANAVSKRRAEFCAGRHCARHALGKIGNATNPILADTNGCPIWPHGRVGSISHTHDYAIAAVARTTDICAIGIDIECWRASSTSWGAIKKMCSSPEQDWIETLAEQCRKKAAHLLFSARESIYKCIYSATGIKVAADHVVVHISPDENSFSTTVMLAHSYCFLEGRFGFNDNYVFSAVWIPA